MSIFVNGVEQVNGNGGAATMDVFFPTTYGLDGIGFQGKHPAAKLEGDEKHGMTEFRVPHDFTSITNVELIVVPLATQASADWDLLAYYFAVGEAYNIHSESDLVTLYSVTNNQGYAVDISTVLSALAAGDQVGVQLIEKVIGHDVALLGVRLRYA